MKQVVELGQSSPVIKEPENTYVRKRNLTKSSEHKKIVVFENPRVPEKSSDNKAQGKARISPRLLEK